MGFLYMLEGVRTPFWNGVMSAVTYLGDQIIFMAAAMLVLWCIDKKWGYRLLLFGMFGNMLNQLLKAIFLIPRPWVIDPEFSIVESARGAATGYSFPSGHTQSAATLFGGVAVWRRRGWVTAACIALVLLTGFSRMYLGVHTPADVLTSLGTGLVTVLVLAWAFKAAENSRTGKYIIGGVGIAFAAAILIYVLTAPKTAANVAEFDESGVKNAYTMLGTMLGLCASYLIDRRWIKYDTRAVWWAQALKLIIGLGIVVGVRAGLKAPLSALMGGSKLADGIRYMIMTLIGGAVWPLTFGWWGKLGRKKRTEPAT